MSARLDSAVAQVERTFPGLQEILRVDVADDGGLGLTALGAGTTRWFHYHEHGLVECFPASDESLRLAAWLRDKRDWRVLSYRPGRRMVVLVSAGEHATVLKGHKRSRSARAAERQRVAEGAMSRGAFRVPRLLRLDGEHEALVFEFLGGSEVELEASSARHYARLGQELAVFQQDGLQQDRVAAQLEPFGVREELAVLESWSRKVLLATGALPPGWSAAMARLERQAHALPAPLLGLCHRDLHDRQVHRDGEEIALLDFDLLCRADVALDPGNLVAHLRWRARQRLHGADETSAHALESAFLAALGRRPEPGFEERLAFYTASAFLRLALVYRLRPRWSVAALELIAWADAVLDEPASID